MPQFYVVIIVSASALLTFINFTIFKLIHQMALVRHC